MFVSLSRTQNRPFSATDLAQAGFFAAMLACGAFLRIPTPLVPVTMQLFVVVLGSFLLPSHCIVSGVGVYLLLGLMGLPVFAGGSGPGYVFTPGFGYLLGFLLSACIGSRMLHGRCSPSVVRLLSAGACMVIVVYFVALAYLFLLSQVYGVEWINLWRALLWGALVFLPGDTICVLLAAFVSRRLTKPLR